MYYYKRIRLVIIHSPITANNAAAAAAVYSQIEYIFTINNMLLK
jgi:hypothetical protein